MSYKKPTVVSGNKNLTLEKAQQLEAENLHGKSIIKNNWYLSDRGKHKVSKEEFHRKLNKLGK